MSKPKIGDLIQIEAWKMDGVIQDMEIPEYGSDDAIRVLVEGHWYHLEPGQYKIIAFAE